MAVVAGAGAGHLVAAFVEPASSPVLAIGSAVVDRVPAGVKELAVRWVGTADKPVLIGLVAIVSLVLGFLAGRMQRRGFGVWLVAALAALSAWAAVTRPAAGAYAVLPSLVAGVTGMAVLALLVARPGIATAPLQSAGRDTPYDESAHGVSLPADATPTGSSPADATPTGSSPADATPTGSSPADATPTGSSPADPGVGRRTVMTVAAGVAGLAAGGLGEARIRSARSATLPVALPRATRPLGPLAPGLDITTPGLTPFRTPVADFYRIDTALVVPRIDARTWRLTIDGEVDAPYGLGLADLLALPMIDADITLNCVSNPVGGDYIGSTRWLGVPVRDVLGRARVRSAADQILSTSIDGMTISTPVEALMDDRGALLAIAMDGAPLTPEHGYPVRLVTPGLYGYVGATKWLTRLTATTYAAQPAYWTERGWAARADVQTQARIDVPRAGSVPAGDVVVAGVAWSQARDGIGRVEVRIDDGPWRSAELGPDAGGHYWRQWRLVWPAAGSGRHTVTVRAADGFGTVQTTTVADPFPSGATGLHTITVDVD